MTHDPVSPAVSGLVVHVATRITDEVFSFIGPATASLVEQGVQQRVIFLDDPHTHAAIERFDHRVALQRVSWAGNWVQRLHRLRRALRELIAARTDAVTIHLHGVLPLMAATGLTSGCADRVRVFFSPHSSRLLGRMKPVGDALLWLAAVADGRRNQPTIANVRMDMRSLPAPRVAAATVVESPISHRFSDAPRCEAPRPLIVGGGQSVVSDGTVDMFARFAVLLSDADSRPEFVWAGETNADQRQRLAAAQVRQVAHYDENTRAEVLSRAWIYLAPAGGRGVPLGLIEAMSCGVACIAAETPFHRDVLTHMRNGLIYRSESEALGMLAQLIDQPEARHALGRNARREAVRRFDPTRFSQQLLHAYGRADSPQVDTTSAWRPASVSPR
jgi:glycosyltransferase involved in cell wall biosynthesis